MVSAAQDDLGATAKRVRFRNGCRGQTHQTQQASPLGEQERHTRVLLFGMVSPVDAVVGCTREGT